MDIEQRALELVNTVRAENGCPILSHLRATTLHDNYFPEHEAIVRAIEALDAYQQEVSEAIELRFNHNRLVFGCLERFVIQPKTDQLKEIIAAAVERCSSGDKLHEAVADELASRGLEIREVG